MIEKPVENISEADLQQLIDARVTESKRIEYKRELPGFSDQGKVKFLKSVTAFANTQGGDLIYGMKATDGIPQHLVPFSIPSMDLVLLRFEQLCGSGVEPRIPSVQYQPVPISGGGQVLVIRVARSWSGPHRVTTGGHAHFYGRNAAGSYRLDVEELRRAFTMSELVAERIRSFRADRLLRLGAGDAPYPLVGGASVVLHIVPLMSMTSTVRVNFSSRSQRQLRALQQIGPPGDGSFNQRINLDGRLAYHPVEAGAKTDTYALLFHSGIIEAVRVWESEQGKRFIPSIAYEWQILDALRNYLPNLGELGIEPPVYVFVTLLGVAGYRFGLDQFRFSQRGDVADRDALVIPEVLIEDRAKNPAEAMRPAFDMVWNAFGFERSFNYDDNGKWIERR